MSEHADGAAQDEPSRPPERTVTMRELYRQVRARGEELEAAAAPFDVAAGEARLRAWLEEHGDD